MHKTAPAYLTALGIFVADQLTKWIMIGPLDLERVGQIVLLPIFNLTWVQNFGISLGLAQAQNDTQRWLLVALTGAIALGVGYWIRREEKSGDRLALGLVLGGALGNIVDRTRFGYVVDFLDLHFGEFRPFYVFNVADAAISIGVVILLLRAFLVRDKAPKERMNMRKALFLLLTPALALGACGIGKQKSLDEFAVARNAPLVIPPDYSLTPPVAGTVSLSAESAQGQAIETLFGSPAQRSATETSLLDAAGRERVATGIRSTAGDPATNVVDKGATTREIIAAPPGESTDASAPTPQ